MSNIEFDSRVQNASEFFVPKLPEGEHLGIKESADILFDTYLKAGLDPDEAKSITKSYIGHGRSLGTGVIWTAEELIGKRTEARIPGIRIIR